MTYDEAIKEIKKEVPHDNYMLVTFGYNAAIILPYKDGMAFMAALKNAEMLSTEYNKQHCIVPLQTESIKAEVFSRKQYERYKLAGLLGLPLIEVIAAETAFAQSKLSKEPYEPSSSF